MQQCLAFLTANKLVKTAEDFFSQLPPADAPLYITAWIMDQYDIILICHSVTLVTDSGVSLTDVTK